ncbi:MAG: hypothetical protein AB7L41_05555 [Flavobacteriaceae bacterium]
MLTKGKFTGTLTALAAAGIAAIALTAPAHAEYRGNGNPSVTIRTPGFSFSVGEPRYSRHGHYRHARRHCEPVFQRQQVWTPYGWRWRTVQVGTNCNRYGYGYAPGYRYYR